MPFLGILLLVSTALWSAATVYFIYCIGVAILTLNFQTFLVGAIIFAFATIAEFILGILND